MNLGAAEEQVLVKGAAVITDGSVCVPEQASPTEKIQLVDLLFMFFRVPVSPGGSAALAGGPVTWVPHPSGPQSWK